jgi:hypothetical protein
MASPAIEASCGIRSQGLGALSQDLFLGQRLSPVSPLPESHRQLWGQNRWEESERGGGRSESPPPNKRRSPKPTLQYRACNSSAMSIPVHQLIPDRCYITAHREVRRIVRIERGKVTYTTAGRNVGEVPWFRLVSVAPEKFAREVVREVPKSRPNRKPTGLLFFGKKVSLGGD